MNDNHSPLMQAALDAVANDSCYSEAQISRLRIAVRETTASAGNQEAPFSFVRCLIAGIVGIALVWFLIGPAWVWSIDELAACLP